MKLTKYPNELPSATKPNNFNLIPQNQELMGENYIFNCVPCPCYPNSNVCPAPQNTNNKCKRSQNHRKPILIGCL